jgi:hypothetical protein
VFHDSASFALFVNVILCMYMYAPVTYYCYVVTTNTKNTYQEQREQGRIKKKLGVMIFPK